MNPLQFVGQIPLRSATHQLTGAKIQLEIEVESSNIQTHNREFREAVLKAVESEKYIDITEFISSDDLRIFSKAKASKVPVNAATTEMKGVKIWGVSFLQSTTDL